MCGIIGIVGKDEVNQSIYDGLTVVQHRGQDAAGILTCDDGRAILRKDNGLVRDVFHTRHMRDLRGHSGIGHVRYPTAGCASSAEAQPFYVNSPFGIALAHNGNLTNIDELKRDLFLEDRRHINTESDAEVAGAHRRVKGAYAVVALIIGYGLVAFRDPHGIRPVVFGKRATPKGDEYMVASESGALDVLGFELIRDIAPGEAVFISLDGILQTRLCAENTVSTPCIFEFVYLARPDSIIDGVSVYKARLRMGETLADKILRDWSDHDIDVVLPIPDTSRTAALQLANKLGVKYREGFIKNRYIGRTFIMPGQMLRKNSVRQTLNAIGLGFRGKNVLLVDDSIVRCTTSLQIIEMARDAGAHKVYFASAAPPVRYPIVYGIDMPVASELVAHNRTDEQVRREIGADKLIYQDLDDLISAVRHGNRALERFDDSVFTGRYITGDVQPEYLAEMERRRNDSAKEAPARPNVAATAVDLHNPA